MTKKTTAVALPDEIVMNKIYLIRGQKVMLDTDLAELYEVENKQLKRQVKRNIERFPEDFMFELTQTEFNNLGANLAPQDGAAHVIFQWHLLNMVC